MRKTFGIIVLAIATLAIACSSTSNTSSSSSTTSTTSNKPNVLFILTDDLDLGEIAQMPHLKQLMIDQGVSFSDYFASVSLCCPSRATTIRGQYSHNTGVETNGGNNGGFETAHRLGIESSTIATWLHAAGYRTALIGKYLNGYPNGVSQTDIPPGWDEWDSAVAGNPYSQFNYTLNSNGKLVHYGSAPTDYGTDVYVKKAQDFINQSAKDHKPSFTYLAVYAPHQPATPAPRDANLFPGAQAPRTPAYNALDVAGKPQFIQQLPLMGPAVQQRVDDLYRRRIQSLQAVDLGISHLVDTLRTTGQLDNTYIVFTSDNGFHLGQFRMPSGKQTAYDFDTHLPLIVRGPGIPKAKTADQLVGNIDLAPTFAAMGGAKSATFVDGRSFLPIAKDPSTDETWRTSYLVEHWQEDDTGAVKGKAPLEPGDLDQTQAPRTRRSAAANSNIPEYHGVRTHRYLYVQYATGERELYDVIADPYQLHNIVTTADPSIVQSLSRQVAALSSCKAKTCVAAEDEPVPH